MDQEPPDERLPEPEDLAALMEAVREAARPSRPFLPVRSEPSWSTLELDPDQERHLSEWRAQAARELGWERVNETHVLPALVELFLSDDELKSRVVTVLREGSSR